ncbi:cellulase family glycosylhydrolase [Phormidesmis sp. 146-33]
MSKSFVLLPRLRTRFTHTWLITTLAILWQKYSGQALKQRRSPPYFYQSVWYSLQNLVNGRFSPRLQIRLLRFFIIGLAIGLYFWIQNLIFIAEAAIVIQPPLSTRGASVVDATGRSVMLRGVNWFGIESDLQAPHGLWLRDYKEMLTQIKSLGYNVIRLPYSVQALRGTSVSGINFDLGSNRELQGKTPIEVMDLVIQEAGRQGLLILLDSHRLNNQRIPELWYGDGFTEADWIGTWTMLAERYKNQPNVIGADLKNEPHGRASWGTNNKATDWRLAAERSGNAILKINKNWLIIVEGVENNVPGQRLKRHWMGGNLEGVRRFPVRLAVRNKLVYSPHEYGPGVFDQPWFSERSFPKNLSDRWEKGFFFIARQKIAPVLVGEFGGRKVDATSKEGIWQRQFVNFLQRNNLSFAYWSWNPNSQDTGGILLDDWQAIDQPKQQLLNQLLPAPTMRSFSTTPVVRPSPSPSSPSPMSSPTKSNSGAIAQLQPKLIVQSDWNEGFCVSLPVTNQGKTPVENWQLQFQMERSTLDQRWNGTFRNQGSQYIVTPPEWGRVVQPGQTIDAGFCAKKLGSDYLPKQLTVTRP